jgi:hypothetical protein
MRCILSWHIGSGLSGTINICRFTFMGKSPAISTTARSMRRDLQAPIKLYRIRRHGNQKKRAS